jgi:hypothetical protein
MSRPARSAPVGGGNAFIVSDWSSQDFMDTVKRRAVPAGRCLNVEAIEPVGYKTGIRIHQGAAIDHDWQLFGNQPQTASGRFWPAGAAGGRNAVHRLVAARPTIYAVLTCLPF